VLAGHAEKHKNANMIPIFALIASGEKTFALTFPLHFFRIDSMIKAFQLFDILVVERVPVSYSLFLTNLALEGPASYRGENRVKPLHVEVR
jgi:hypothetical protein